MNEQDVLIYIIKNKGTCKHIMCPECPLYTKEQICLITKYQLVEHKFKARYGKAMEIFIQKYGKASLLELIL